MGVAAAILGKSLYTGTLDLKHCVERVQEYSNSTFSCNSNIVELHIANMPFGCCTHFLTCDKM